MKNLGFDLILLGDPTAGKDTQAEIIKKNYRVKPVESGKYLRQHVVRNNTLGRQLKKTFGKGFPAPVKVIKDFILWNIRSVRPSENLLFIGNPRLKPEAQFLAKLLKNKRRDFFAIYLTLPTSEIEKRTTRRQRDVQDSKYLKNRLAYTKRQVTKTILYFKTLKKLKMVNGNQSIARVSKDIQKVINDYQQSQGN